MQLLILHSFIYQYTEMYKIVFTRYFTWVELHTIMRILCWPVHAGMSRPHFRSEQCSFFYTTSPETEQLLNFWFTQLYQFLTHLLILWKLRVSQQLFAFFAENDLLWFPSSPKLCLSSCGNRFLSKMWRFSHFRFEKLWRIWVVTSDPILSN